MRSRWAVRAGVHAGWVLAAVAAATASHAASDPRILQFERLRAVTPDRDAVLRKAGASQLRELKFDAFGRRFELSLDANTPLTDQLDAKAQASSVKLYRGRLDNIAGSWARLATKGDSVQGMFWDGVDLYVIEPASQVQRELATPGDGAASGSIVFRLSDVVMDASDAACATEAEDSERKASAQFESLMSELKGAPAVMRATGAHLRLQMSAMGDASFLQRYASEADARDAILVRLNNVDGIFSAQLGVELQVPAIFVNAAPTDPLSDASSANALLQELASLRKRSPRLNSYGLTHLFTGRDLNGETVGIGYLNRLCHAEYGVGLTEARGQTAWRDSLIAAHEIGHNFGANHDGDAQGACPSAQTGMYLMSSSVSGNDRFSQCSIETMRPRMLAAACIATLPDADLTVASNLGVRRIAVTRPLEWRLDVANVGGVAAERVRTEILVPPVVSIDDAYVVGGSCTSGAGAILCQLGDVPGGAMRAVNLTLRSDVIGTSSISVRIASDNDAVLTNNLGAGELNVQQEADLGVVLEGPAKAALGAEVRLAFAAANATSTTASDVRLTLDLPSGFKASAASLAAGACTIAPSRIECTLASLAGEATASGAVTLTASTAGELAVLAAVSGGYFDSQPANDAAQHTFTIESAEPAAPQSAPADRGGGGGGGSASFLFLLALASLRFARR
jgi:hypothetical protein